MDLKHLTNNDVCSTCGAKTVSETQDWKHTNGQWHEQKTFKCGHTIEWSPNFMMLMVLKKCPHCDDEKEREAKRSIAREKLVKYIKRLDVDDDWKDRILSYA